MTDSDRALNLFIKKYYIEYQGHFNRATAKELTRISFLLSSLTFAEFETAIFQITGQVLDSIQARLNADPAARKSIKKWTNDAYRFFKANDTSIYPSGFNKPILSFNNIDLDSITALRDIDNLYLGKFLNNSATKNTLMNFMRDEYGKSGLPTTTKDIEKFTNKFGTRLGLQSYQIKRIVDTSLSLNRSWAHISAMDDVGATRTKLVGIRDSKQSDICKVLTDPSRQKTFSVPSLVRIRDEQIQMGDRIAELSPLLNRTFDGDALKSLSGDQLTAQGYGNPPFHEHCRTRLVIIIEE